MLRLKNYRRLELEPDDRELEPDDLDDRELEPNPDDLELEDLELEPNPDDFCAGFGATFCVGCDVFFVANPLVLRGPVEGAVVLNDFWLLVALAKLDVRFVAILDLLAVFGDLIVCCVRVFGVE